MCVYVSKGEMCSGAHRSQKRALASLELEFQAIMSCPVGDGKEPSPLEEQQVLLTTEPALQPLYQLLTSAGVLA